MLKSSISPYKKIIFFYIVLGFSLQLLSAYGIHTFQRLLDAIPFSSGINELTGLLIGYGLALAGCAILNYVMVSPETSLPKSITERLKLLALGKISRMDYQAYSHIGTGEWIQVIENGARAGSGIVYNFYLRIFAELLPTLLFSLVFIGFYSSTIMWVIAGGYIVVFLMTRLLLRFLYSIKESLLAHQEKLSRYSVRGFMELVVFRLNRRYSKEIDKLTGTANQIVHQNVQIRLIHESFFALFELLIIGVKIVVLAVGITDIVAGRSTLGVTLALLLLIDKVYSPIAIFNVIYIDYKLDALTYRRFEKGLNAPSDRNLEQGMQVNQLQGKIVFEDVSFGYEKDQPLLKQVSFSLPASSSTAIVGLSGSGKSTIVKLLLGLLKKDSGRLTIDGTEIDELQLDSLYQHLSYISQDAPIFDDTLRGNLIFDEVKDDSELYDILRLALLESKVRSLPEGLDTQVGERGLKLSGGEKQRLAFARMLAQSRDLIVLDEPVSALDNISERQLMETVLETFRDRTLIIVAHRLHAIRQVDLILLMRGGQLIDQGSFEELLERSEYFRELWSKDGVEHEAV
ncbi:ABC transporter ATP-binding protein [Saccharibacillus sp. JS10]|uniref:ABC transporter ATP-binding protein n=1 Tax=Saccharibacillus sp. JS10 TaxID=2950552 RepID=UPI00210A1B9E|nr:ABC transporter ATP-binding protein [Saccharibacillus sp. JS10]MCQ4086422.1 ABC transporter ATP-binding protein/permease [Saccharibacillus sp. JS10]